MGCLVVGNLPADTHTHTLWNWMQNPLPPTFSKSGASLTFSGGFNDPFLFYSPPSLLACHPNLILYTVVLHCLPSMNPFAFEWIPGLKGWPFWVYSRGKRGYLAPRLLQTPAQGIPSHSRHTGGHMKGLREADLIVISSPPLEPVKDPEWMGKHKSTFTASASQRGRLAYLNLETCGRRRSSAFLFLTWINFVF